MIVSFMIIIRKTMKQNRFIKKFLVVALMAFAVSVFLGEASSDAASKAKLESKKESIAVNGSFTIRLTGKVKKASYQFTSKNKKIATVSNKGVVKGVAAGKAKIIVVQKLNKKKTNVGTFTIIVKKAGIFSPFKTGTWVANQPGIQKDNPYTLEIYEYISYMNEKATYKVYSANSKKLSITEKGVVKDVNGEGTVNVIFKETYKGKTRTVGNITVELKSPSFIGKKNVEIALNESYDISSNIEAVGRYFEICSEEDKIEDPNSYNDNNSNDSEEDSVLKSKYDSNGEWQGVLKGVGEGKRYIKLYAYDYNQKKYITKPFAEFTITVKKVENAEKIKTDFDVNSDDYDEDEYVKSTDTLNMYVERAEEIAIYQTPYNYTGEIKVTSSDSGIVKAVPFEKNDEYNNDSFEEPGKGYIGKIILIPIKKGTAEITIEANGAKRVFNVTVKEYSVYADGEEYYASIMLDKAVDCSNGEVPFEDFSVESSNTSIATAEVNYYHTDDAKIRVISFDVNTGEKSGVVTFTVKYKGEKVGSFKINVKDSDDSYDDDEY